MRRPQNVRRILIAVNPNTFHLLPKQQNRITVNLWPKKHTIRLVQLSVKLADPVAPVVFPHKQNSAPVTCLQNYLPP